MDAVLSHHDPERRADAANRAGVTKESLAMKKMRFAALGLLLAGSVMGAIAAETTPARNRPVATSAPPKNTVFGRWGVDLAGMDKTVNPGDDFFRYMNGAWFDKAVIPADRTSTGSFLDLDIQSEDQVRAILVDLEARQNNLSPEERRVRDLYHSYVDTARVEQLGLKPAERDLQTIAAIKTTADVARVMGSIKLGAEGIFDSRINVDDKKPGAYAIFIRASGLGLPDRDYYLLDEKGIVAARTGYRTYIADMLKLGAVPDAETKAAAIFNLETEIAKLHWARAERRNADKVYNPMSVTELQTFAPQFPWTVFLNESGIPNAKQRRVIVEEQSTFPPLAALFAKTPVDVWRDYF